MLESASDGQPQFHDIVIDQKHIVYIHSEIEVGETFRVDRRRLNNHS